jgi:pterin-4a-carbinolamine dehydratase
VVCYVTPAGMSASCMAQGQPQAAHGWNRHPAWLIMYQRVRVQAESAALVSTSVKSVKSAV